MIDYKQIHDHDRLRSEIDYEDFNELMQPVRQWPRFLKVGIACIFGIALIVYIGLASAHSDSSESSKVDGNKTNSTINATPQPLSDAPSTESSINSQLQDSKQQMIDAQKKAADAQAVADKSAADAQKLYDQSQAQYNAAMASYYQDQTNYQILLQQQQQAQARVDQLNNTPVATTASCPDPTYVNNLYMQLAQAKTKLANAPQEAQSLGGGYGMTASAVQTATNSLTSQYTNQINTIQNQIDSYRNINPGC